MSGAVGLVEVLTGIAARRDRRGVMVTLSGRPMADLLAGVFGDESAFNLVFDGRDGDLAQAPAFVVRAVGTAPVAVAPGDVAALFAAALPEDLALAAAPLGDSAAAPAAEPRDAARRDGAAAAADGSAGASGGSVALPDGSAAGPGSVALPGGSAAGPGSAALPHGSAAGPGGSAGASGRSAGASGGSAAVPGGSAAMVLRIVDAGTLRRIAAVRPDLVAAAAAVVVDIRDATGRTAALRLLAGLGWTETEAAVHHDRELVVADAVRRAAARSEPGAPGADTSLGADRGLHTDPDRHADPDRPADPDRHADPDWPADRDLTALSRLDAESDADAASRREAKSRLDRAPAPITAPDAVAGSSAARERAVDRPATHAPARSARVAHPTGAAAIEPAPPMRRLVIVDPCLEPGRGHFLPLAHCITAAAQDLGVAVAWATSVRVPADVAPAGVLLRPCFPRSYFDVAHEEQWSLDIGPEIAAHWRGVAAELGGPGVHFLVHSADPALIRAALAITTGGAAVADGSVFHLAMPNHPWRMPGRAAGMEASLALGRLARAPERGRTLFLWTETERLARDLGRRHGILLPTLPLPVPPWTHRADGAGTAPEAERAGHGAGQPEDPATAAAAIGTPSRPLAVAFLGEARLEKGFLDLPALATALSQMPRVARRVRLDIHVAPPHLGFLPEHAAAIAALRRFPFVALHHQPLDDADYRRFMAAAAVVLLPYDPEQYSGRGSGIVTEAIACGRIVAARASATFAEAAGSGVVRLYETPAEFAATIAAILENLSELTIAAAERARPFRLRRDPHAYVQRLEQRVAFARA